MTEHQSSRTLVKSTPELWAECSDAGSLARQEAVPVLASTGTELHTVEDPSLNVTVPPGVPAPGAAGATVAV